MNGNKKYFKYISSEKIEFQIPSFFLACNEEKPSEGDMGLKETGGVFIVLIVGCFVALFIGLFEFLVNIEKIAVEEKV